MKKEVGVKAQDVLKAIDNLSQETKDAILPKSRGG